MRQAPLNSLITTVMAALLWVGTAIFAGQQLGDSVVLQVRTVGDFVQTYRLVMAGAAVVGLLLCLYWFAYGGRDTTSARLGEARRLWGMLLAVEVVVAVVALVAIVVLFSDEALSGGNLAEILVLLLLQTAVLYWASTFLMSPRAVEYIPWGKR